MDTPGRPRRRELQKCNLNRDAWRWTQRLIVSSATIVQFVAGRYRPDRSRILCDINKRCCSRIRSTNNRNVRRTCCRFTVVDVWNSRLSWLIRYRRRRRVCRCSATSTSCRRIKSRGRGRSSYCRATRFSVSDSFRSFASRTPRRGARYTSRCCGTCSSMLLTRVLHHLALATLAAWRPAWRIAHVQPAGGFTAKECVANKGSACRVQKRRCLVYFGFFFFVLHQQMRDEP